MEEIEIKFAVTEVKRAAEKLQKMGFRIAADRHREENYLFDDGSGSLRRAGRVLRVRKTAVGQTVTFKGPVSTASKLKRREEIECRVESAETMIRILEEVGFHVGAEYSKYRTVFEKDGLNVSLDETEAGNYMEVEGPSEKEIRKLGKELGYSEQDFVRRTYAEMIAAKRTRSESAGARSLKKRSAAT
jgi:predicted adenylyl cyclase CyaB